MVARISLIAALSLGSIAAYHIVDSQKLGVVAWSPPPAPPLTGVYDQNTRLSGVEKLLVSVGVGPEDTAFDSRNRIYAGMADGRIIRADVDGSNPQVFANTGGRPLGMDFAPAGDLIVADAMRGVLSVSADGVITVLAYEEGGIPFRFTNDVDVSPDGVIYFSDASSKYGPNQFAQAILEHGPNGRLLAYDPHSESTRLLLGGLYFANGVALSPDGSFVLVNETGAYRVTRYWLDGPRAGLSDTFLDNLPGFPDGISSNGKDKFWVALYARRDATLDALMPWPRVRAIVMRLPDILLPIPRKYGFVIGVDLNANVVHNLQDPSGAFAPVTSVEQFGDTLYLGSLVEAAVGRIPAPREGTGAQ